MTSYQNLESRFRQHSRLGELRSISQWDEAVVMPSGAGGSRGEVLGELAMFMQALISSPDIGVWTAECESFKGALNPWQLANFNEMKRIHLENTVVPPDLNRRLVVARLRCEQLWRKLRAENDWAGFAPSLKEVLDLTRESLTILGEHFNLPLYDTALMIYSKGLKTEAVETLFAELKAFLPELTQAVVARQSREKVVLPDGRFPKEAQKALALELMKAVGFDFDRGRLDESHHPFCGGTSRDVRITTRYSESDFTSSLMAVLHETGHALYEQNLPADWVEQPVGVACGMAVHESQSLLMEMQVARSIEFLEFAAPYIRAHLGSYVKNPESLDPENLLKVFNRVRPGLIRVDADEVTYPAHVILRFEIERDLLENRWPLKELPAVWNEKMKSYLGLNTLGNDKNGCMQDVHWPSGGWGYFPAYTFGAVIAAQLFAVAQRARPTLRQEFAVGKFGGLHEWLKAHIWTQGSRLDTLQLVTEAAGPLASESFRRHLEARYL